MDDAAQGAAYTAAVRTPRTLHVISPLSWIADAFDEPFLGAPQTAASSSSAPPLVTSQSAVSSPNACFHFPASLPVDSPSIVAMPAAPPPTAAMAAPTAPDRTEFSSSPCAANPGTAATDRAASRVPGWRIVRHSALEPVQDFANDDAVWIAPEILVALNAWRERQGLFPLAFRAPSPRWPDLLPGDVAGRSVLIAAVAEIRTWSAFPHDLGAQPWSQLCNGRVAGFNAARRDLDALRTAIGDAPAHSTIMLSEHVPGISEEWNVFVHHGVAAAASPYCLHTPPDSHTIITVFDLPEDSPCAASARHSQRFHRRCRALASQAAERAAAATGTDDASMIVAFRAENDSPIVLEIDPVWCSAPYPYDVRGMLAFMDAIAEARVRPSAQRSAAGSALGQRQENDTVFEPDPWMAAQHANRYGRY